eukprot:s1069_g23.t1
MARPQEPEPIKEKMFKDLGCYCKKVASMKDCPSSKVGKRLKQPEGYHWFHAEVSPGKKKPHRCCKLAWTAWTDRVGWRYTRQATFELCTKEERPVPPEVCCRVGIGEQKVGIRIRKAEALGSQKIPEWWWHPKTFGKSFPIVALKDITGATDYDGSAVSPADTVQFLKNKVVAGLLGEDEVDADPESFFCKQEFDSMLEDTGSCRLRNQPPTECCCLEEAIQEAQRCLPVPNAGASTVGPLRVNGSYHNDTRFHGVVKGTISWPSNPEELEKDLPVLLKSKDPNVTNSLEFDWSPGSQWHAKCVLNQSVQYVKSKEVEERVRTGHKRGLAGMPISKYRTEYHLEFSQAEKPMCISYDYSRICLLGYGLYVKQLRPGVCTKRPGRGNADPLQLQNIGGFTYQCPEKYRSGTEGALKFDPLCSCDGGC